MALDSLGNVYVANLTSSRIEKYTNTGTLITTFGSGQLDQPSAVAVDSSGNMWVGNILNHQIVELASNGTLVRSISEVSPYSLDVDTLGNVWVADPNTSSHIKEFSRYRRFHSIGR